LEGNEEMDRAGFNEEYWRLEQGGRVGVNLLEGEGRGRMFGEFIKGVLKHFKADIAAKVAYVVNHYAGQKDFGEQHEDK